MPRKCESHEDLTRGKDSKHGSLTCPVGAGGLDLDLDDALGRGEAEEGRAEEEKCLFHFSERDKRKLEILPLSFPFCHPSARDLFTCFRPLNDTCDRS